MPYHKRTIVRLTSSRALIGQRFLCKPGRTKEWRSFFSTMRRDCGGCVVFTDHMLGVFYGSVDAFSEEARSRLERVRHSGERGAFFWEVDSRTFDSTSLSVVAATSHLLVLAKQARRANVSLSKVSDLTQTRVPPIPCRPLREGAPIQTDLPPPAGPLCMSRKGVSRAGPLRETGTETLEE